jgi:hypothetical protein
VYSGANCACFLNPDPGTWIDSTVYQVGDCVKHGYYVYFSVIADNQYNEPDPGSTVNWYPYGYANIDPDPPAYVLGKTYSIGDCAYKSGYNQIYLGTWFTYYVGETLSEWNSFSPYGGVGKSPAGYVLAFESNYNKTTSPTRSQTLKGKIVLTHSIGAGLSCAYLGRGTANFYDSEEGPFVFTLNGSYSVSGGGAKVTAQAFLTSPGLPAGDYGGFDTGFLYARLPDVSGGRYCKITNTDSYDYTTDARYWGTTSARPIDCDYVQYSTSIVYYSGACVYHVGRFWKCIAANGPGTTAGVQEPDDGSSYWEEA